MSEGFDDNVRRIKPTIEGGNENRVFEVGDEVKVLRRQTGEIESGWIVEGFNNSGGRLNAMVKRIEKEDGETLRRDVTIEELQEWNK